MKRLILTLAAYCLAAPAFAQQQAAPPHSAAMKMNAGIVTAKLAETKAFYTGILGFEVSFENEFYLLLHTPGQTAAISFLLPRHPSQQPLFQPPFTGQGMYLTIEVDDVDRWYDQLRKKGVPIAIGLRNEPWGDRHFAIKDPNGIGIDIVTYAAPETK